MLAEVVKLFGPRLVDLHKYVPTCNTGQKRSNWSVLNRKVFHKLGLSVSGRDPKGDRQHPWGHRAHPVCSEGQGGGLEDPPGMAGHVGTITWPWPLLCWDTGSLPADESKTRNRGALAAPGPWAAAAAAGGEGAGAGSPAGDRQGAGLGALQVAWPSMRRGRGSQAGPLTGGARECIPEIPRSRGESTVGHHPSETDQPALPVIRHQRPRVRGCRLTGLATQTYWTASSRALGPSQGAEGSSLRRKPGSGALALFWASLFPLSLRVSSTPGFRRCLGVTAVQQPLRALSAMPACSGWASRLYVWTWDSGGWGVQATQPRCRRSCRNGDDKALPAGSASLDAAFLRKQEGGVILWFASAGWQGGSPVSARPLAALIPCPVWAVC
ncbi:uncharacterized protein [Bos taurus]|nr:uncharacterized protein LOC101903854 isoform X3 [Bos taurus]